MKISIACALAAGLALAGCQSTPKVQLIYVKTDGSHIPPDARAKFETDRTICVGELNKAQLSGVQISTGNVFADAQSALERDRAGAGVMLGCMAGKGYKLAPAG